MEYLCQLLAPESSSLLLEALQAVTMVQVIGFQIIAFQCGGTGLSSWLHASLSRVPPLTSTLVEAGIWKYTAEWELAFCLSVFASQSYKFYKIFDIVRNHIATHCLKKSIPKYCIGKRRHSL